MRLYDTLTAAPVDVVPSENEVRMYVCGLTPYSAAHVGHALKAVVFDTLRRYLEWRGYAVRHVENFTDIDDRLIERAGESGESMGDIAARHSAAYLDGLRRLNVLPATDYPRATDHVDDIIALIERLVESGVAYQGGADVYYRVRSFPGYGKLSKRKIDDLLSGARVEPGEHKEDPLDFALWKGAKPGEPSWESPWGPGRPGWHIECSAMAMAMLGETLDIHGGGADLIFPHHENEIAQSEAATGKPFARIWVHNALLQLGEEKMAKSTGNIVGLTEALDRWGGDTLRLFFLSGHYRSPITYTDDALASAAAGVERIRNAMAVPLASGATPVPADATRERFLAAMEDDLNTAQAVAALFDLVREINRGRDQGHDTVEAVATLRELSGVLGLTFELEESAGDVVPLVDLLVELRRDLRGQKQFALADRIRDCLAELGYELRDSGESTTWIRHGR